MRNNAAYLPESPIVYIILPKSIRNRASFAIFYPVILYEGRIVGNWKKDSKKKALTVETSLFDESLDLPEDLLKKAVDYYCSFHAQKSGFHT